MKLKPTQVFGLGAIVIFGGMTIFRLTQPSEREIMERRLASLPSISAPSGPIEFPPVDLPTITALDAPGAPSSSPALADTTPATDYLALGSQDARDDLYCAGMLRAHFNPLLKSDGPTHAGEILEYTRILAGSGVTKLRAQGLAADLEWVYFDTAHDDKAKADHAANTPRISTDACEARGKALPADTLKLP